MNEKELKPCPFCGNTKSVECVKENNCYGDNYYYVGCVPFYGGCGGLTMASCKDCLHYEVCSAEKSCLPDYVNCKYFKDRNRFVELPCKLGERFYTIDRRSDKKQVRDYFAEEITICVVRGV